MITRDDIEELMQAAEGAGYDIEPRDISNAVLARYYEDRSLIVDDDKGYFAEPRIKWLMQYLSEAVFHDSDITFDDNRKAMLELVEQTKRKLAAGEIEAKDALKIEADLRVKLNDKFRVQDENKDKVVFVEKKYNMVCKHGYECYLPTKEDLMEMYGLVERTKD